jgi:transcriptional regulator with PAS, ATPase and Fis domain
MNDKHVKNLLNRLISVAENVSMGRYGMHNVIFELTKTGQYPRLITRLAESFGMMIVKVEAREFHLEQIIEDLKKTQAELFAAKQKLSHENINLKKNLRRTYTFSGILGTSRAIKDVIAKAERIADTTVNVLLTGETGTGKELIAKAIHFSSSRSLKSFIAINCSAIPESLFESEMFGIEKGVATGVAHRIGKIEAADGGTIFLDEIGDMPLSCQAKMLRAIEEREIEKVGSRKTTPVDIRILAATNRDLKKEVEKGSFREDLFYRLNVVHFNVPPLRERKDDILLLTNFFLEQYSKKFDRRRIRFEKDAIDLLKKYPWPGNVRELENEIERAVALSYSDTIAVSDLSEELRSFHLNGRSSASINLSLKDEEKRLIRMAMKESGGNKTLASKKLGFSREGLRKKMKRFGLE